MITCNGLIVILKWAISKYFLKISVLTSYTVNINRNNPYKQKLLGFLIVFQNVKKAWNQNFEKHWFMRSSFLLCYSNLLCYDWFFFCFFWLNYWKVLDFLLLIWIYLFLLGVLSVLLYIFSSCSIGNKQVYKCNLFLMIWIFYCCVVMVFVLKYIMSKIVIAILAFWGLMIARYILSF